MIEEVIPIKDKDAPGGLREETMTVRATVRGPVISGPVLGYDGEALLSRRGEALHLAGSAVMERWQGTERVRFRISDAALPNG